MAQTDLQDFVYSDEASPARLGQPIKRDRIYIQSKNTRPKCQVIRVNNEAAVILERLERMTGQPKSYLASQLIAQGAKIIHLCPAECRDCEDRETCELAGL
jgi:hypothetical protein